MRLLESARLSLTEGVVLSNYSPEHALFHRQQLLPLSWEQHAFVRTNTHIITSNHMT